MFSFKPRLRAVNFLSMYIRERSVWTSEKVVKSPFKDVEIPNLTLHEYIFKDMDKWATKTAVVCGLTNRRYTYEQVYKTSRTFGANLRKKLNLKDGDVVGMALPNMPEYPIVSYGILAAGGVVTTINPIYTAYEIQKQIILSDTKLIITNDKIAPTVKKALKLAKKDIPIICLNMSQTQPEGTISYKEFAEDNHVDLRILNESKVNCDDVAVLLFSSGTTGLPKGVQLTHKNLVSNSAQQNTETRQYEYTTASHQDSLVVFLPMFHSYGLSIQMIHKMSVGLKIVTLPKFQPNTFLDTLLKNKTQLLYVAPPIVLFLGNHPDVTAKHLEHLTCISCGAAPLPSVDTQRVLEKANREFQFSQVYGLTETSPLVSLTPHGQKTYDDVGYCLPNMEMRIVDKDTKNLGPNEVGELLVRGPNIMKGYLKNPQANEDVFVGDWLRTGDIAKIDETGLLTISDRLKELIKVKGYQVPPAELENVVKEHPAVLDVAVVGVPDDVTGERPRAFVVLKPGAQATDNDILQFVSEKVAPYKKLKQVSFVDNIPKNQSGKILRRVVKEQYC